MTRCVVLLLVLLAATPAVAAQPLTPATPGPGCIRGGDLRCAGAFGVALGGGVLVRLEQQRPGLTQIVARPLAGGSDAELRRLRSRINADLAVSRIAATERPGGGAVVGWVETRRRLYALQLRETGADGSPIGPLRRVADVRRDKGDEGSEPGLELATSTAGTVLAAWSRPGSPDDDADATGVVQVVAPTVPYAIAPPRTVTERGIDGIVVTELGEGFAAWWVRIAGSRLELRGRVLGPDGAPRGAAVTLQRTSFPRAELLEFPVVGGGPAGALLVTPRVGRRSVVLTTQRFDTALRAAGPAVTAATVRARTLFAIPWLQPVGDGWLLSLQTSRLHAEEFDFDLGLHVVRLGTDGRATRAPMLVTRRSGLVLPVWDPASSALVHVEAQGARRIVPHLVRTILPR